MLKCSECCDGKSSRMCTACKAMQEESNWKWELDNGCRRIRCPKCDFALTFGAWRYENPFNFCPGCGEKLKLGEQTKMDI